MEVRRGRTGAGFPAGGTLVVTAKMHRGTAAALLVGDAGGRFAVQGS